MNRRHFTFTVLDRRCHASVETRRSSSSDREVYGSVDIQTYDGDFVIDIAYHGSGEARVFWLAFVCKGGLDHFWKTGQHVLAGLTRASLQFFLRFFPETRVISINDYLHFDIGATYEEGSTNMYVSPISALIDHHPSWFVARGFPIHPKSKQEVSDVRVKLEAFLYATPVHVMEVVSQLYAVWEIVKAKGVVEDLERRCSQHSTWRHFLESYGGGLESMMPWLPCFANKQHELHLTGINVYLDAHVLVREPKMYTESAEEADEFAGSPTPLIASPLGYDGLRDTEGTPDRIVIKNEVLYTTCLSWADVESEED